MSNLTEKYRNKYSKYTLVSQQKRATFNIVTHKVNFYTLKNQHTRLPGQSYCVNLDCWRLTRKVDDSMSMS